MGQKYKEPVLLAIFICLFVVVSIMKPMEFLTVQNLQSMAFQLAEFGIICLGIMLVMTTGGIDLSIISIATLSGIMGAFVLNSSIAGAGLKIFIAVAVTLFVALICGLINGLIVSYIGVSSMIATLGTSILYRGISLNLTKGGAISGFPAAYNRLGNSNFLGIPIPMVIFIFMILLVVYILDRTRWGRQVMMVGVDSVAAKYSGIYIEKVILYSYIYAAILAGLGAIVMGARYNSIREDYGSSYLLKSIVAVVMAKSGTDSGKRRVAGIFLAVMILQILSSGFSILGLSQSVVDLVLGLMLIAVLMINYFTTNLHKKRANRATLKE